MACLLIGNFSPFQKLQAEILKLNQTVETMTRSSVENSLMKIMAYASRPLPDLNKYKALEMLKSLQLTAQDTKHDRQNFYRLVYQTVRGKRILCQRFPEKPGKAYVVFLLWKTWPY